MNKKLVNKKVERILWMDLEMTGLDTKEDRIIEVAAIVTDWNFKEIATYEAAVLAGPRLVEKRMMKGPAAEFWASIPETRDALIEQNKKSGRSGRTIENELLKFIDKHFDKDTPVLLAGNSIHMDRQFINNEWKRINERLNYRMLDVSAWKVVFNNRYNKSFAKPEVHRALDDIRGSIAELQYYLGKASIK